jgi:hypothetical protein
MIPVDAAGCDPLVAGDHWPAGKLCCLFVTVQTKSELPHRTCREYEQHHFKTPKPGGHRFERALRAIGLRQIVAKIPIKTGISVPPALFRNLRRSRRRRLPIASNILMYGPFLIKLVADLGKT